MVHFNFRHSKRIASMITSNCGDYFFHNTSFSYPIFCFIRTLNDHFVFIFNILDMCHFKESDETNLANFSMCTSIDMAFVNFSKNVLYALFGSSKIVKH